MQFLSKISIATCVFAWLIRQLYSHIACDALKCEALPSCRMPYGCQTETAQHLLLGRSLILLVAHHVAIRLVKMKLLVPQVRRVVVQLLENLAKGARDFLDRPFGPWVIKQLLQLEPHNPESVPVLEVMVCCVAWSFEDNIANIMV